MYGDFMKILTILLLLLCVGCSKKEETPELPIKDPAPIEDPIPEYADSNTVKVGLYTKTSYGRKLITDFSGSWGNDVDIKYFSTIFTDETEIYDRSDYKVLFKKYRDSYEEKVKIGYMISYEAEGKQINHILKDTSNFFEYYKYMQVYLYDDINNSGFYSHLTTMNENTIITTIKLTTTNLSYVTSPIVLTVFTYDTDDDFDPDTGIYRGNSSYSVTIKKTN